MSKLIRFAIVAALSLGSTAVAGVAVAAPALNTGPVPAEWGKPTYVLATFAVVGRDNGRLPGRLGNQHVYAVDTVDEESVVRGSVVDWWCPAGAIAPVNTFDETSCRLKAEYGIDFDSPRLDELVQNWSPTVRYINMRIPIVLLDSANNVVDHSKVTIHLKASGAPTQTWGDGDYQDVLSRTGARVTGGHIMGKAWLKMSSVEVTYGEMWLLRYYNP